MPDAADLQREVDELMDDPDPMLSVSMQNEDFNKFKAE